MKIKVSWAVISNNSHLLNTQLIGVYKQRTVAVHCLCKKKEKNNLQQCSTVPRNNHCQETCGKFLYCFWAPSLKVVVDKKAGKVGMGCYLHSAWIWRFQLEIKRLVDYFQTVPRILCNGNGAISHLQTEMGFVEDFRTACIIDKNAFSAPFGISFIERKFEKKFS